MFISYYGLIFGKQNFGQIKYCFALRKMPVPFSMAVGNVELMHERFPKHLCRGTARLKKDTSRGRM